MNRSQLLKSGLTMMLITTMTLWIVLYLTGSTSGLTIEYDMMLSLSFILIGVVSLLIMIAEVSRRGISLYIMHWFFVLVFFSLIPYFQYTRDLFLFPVDNEDLFSGNILIMVWCFIYFICYKQTTRKTSVRKKSDVFRDYLQRTDKTDKNFVVLTLISVAIAVYLFTRDGITLTTSRMELEKFITDTSGWGPGTLIANQFLRPLLTFALVVTSYFIFIYKKDKKSFVLYLCLIVLLISNLLVNSPLSYARFSIFVIFFGVAVLFSYKRVRGSFIYITMLYLGIFASSFVNVLRNSTLSGADFSSQKFEWGYFFEGHFDAYENFIHTVRYVRESGIVYGHQLLGALLFFVPRTMWPAKPVGSGPFIAGFLAQSYTVDNTNIANPPIGEMLLNFHVIGVIVGAAVYGVATGWLDRRYWQSIDGDELDARGQIDYYRLLYPFLIGLFLFNLRGDFMSSYAYTVGFVIAFISVMWIMRLNWGVRDYTSQGGRVRGKHITALPEEIL